MGLIGCICQNWAPELTKLLAMGNQVGFLILTELDATSDCFALPFVWVHQVLWSLYVELLSKFTLNVFSAMTQAWLVGPSRNHSLVVFWICFAPLHVWLYLFVWLLPYSKIPFIHISEQIENIHIITWLAYCDKTSEEKLCCLGKSKSPAWKISWYKRAYVKHV